MHPVAVFVLITLGVAFAVIVVAVVCGCGKLRKERDIQAREHFYPYNMYIDEEVRK